jgi:membrane protein implicated in regulation of membrane protease activity
MSNKRTREGITRNIRSVFDAWLYAVTALTAFAFLIAGIFMLFNPRGTEIANMILMELPKVIVASFLVAIGVLLFLASGFGFKRLYNDKKSSVQSPQPFLGGLKTLTSEQISTSIGNMKDLTPEQIRMLVWGFISEVGDRNPSNTKAVIALLDQLVKRKRIPKKRRY